MLTTVTSKGQVTIPKAIRDFLHVQPHDRVDFVVEGGQVVVRPVKTLKDLRWAVTAAGPSDFEAERARAKAAVGKRVSEEMS
jgi:AbrB family looped-hinge helix DNA binding protein